MFDLLSPVQHMSGVKHINSGKIKSEYMNERSFYEHVRINEEEALNFSL